MSTQIRKSEKIWILIGATMLTMLSMVFLNHIDQYFISTWGMSLLQHISSGNLRSYAMDLMVAGEGTNYNLFQNASVALWILPLYLLDHVLNLSLPLLAYQLMIKAVVSLLHIVCARLLYDIIRLLNFDDRKAFLAAMLYVCSPFVQVHGIGIGQIDCIGILFLLISVRCYLTKKYYRMSLFIGFAVLSKVFVVLFYLPLLFLFIDKIKKIWRYVVIACTPVVLNRLLTGALIDGYGKYAGDFNNEMFISRLFMTSFNKLSVIVVISVVVAGICLMIGMHGVRKSYHWLLFPMLLFLGFFTCVYWHPQWVLYMIPFLLIMGCYIHKEAEYAIFYLGMLIGFILYGLTEFATYSYSSITVGDSLFGSIVNKNQEVFPGQLIIDHVSEYVYSVGISVFLACLILLILAYFLNVRNKARNEEESQPERVCSGIWLAIMALPTLIYIAVFVGIYLIQ